VKRKYGKIIINFVLDGRNVIMRNSKDDGVSELIDIILKSYLSIDGHRYEFTSMKLIPSSKTKHPFAMAKRDIKDIKKEDKEVTHDRQQ
jgi:hypothetical protein